MLDVEDSRQAFAYGPWETGEPDAWAPGALDELDPGPVLAALLASIDVATLSGHDRVRVLRAHRRMASHYEAQAYRDMAFIDEALEHHNTQTDIDEGAAAEAEIRAALSWTRRHAEAELGFALELASRLPDVHSDLLAGHLDVRKAKVIAAEVVHLEDAPAGEVVASILDDAPNLTTGELRALLKQRTVDLDPADAARRLEEAHDRRRVEVHPTQQGTGTVVGRNLAPIDAQAINRRIHHLARAAKAADDPRTADQVRADVFVDLLLGRANLPGTESGDGSASGAEARTIPAAAVPAGSVEIRVDLTTLARLDDSPADLAGFGPVVADIARQVASQQALTDGSLRTSWTFTATDPDTDDVVFTGPIRRRPPAGTARLVRSLRPVCSFPGCRMPASGCDLDHTTPWSSGGQTAEHNLAPLCRHDHRIKGELGWRYAVDPDGTITWSSPLGHRYDKQRPPP